LTNLIEALYRTHFRQSTSRNF